MTTDRAFHDWTEKQPLWDESHEWPFKGGYEAGKTEGRREGYAEALKTVEALIWDVPNWRLDTPNDEHTDVVRSVVDRDELVIAVRALESEEE